MTRDSAQRALEALEVRPIVVASHPRSGTHLLMDTFRRHFDECRSWKWPGESLERLYFTVDALFDAHAPALTEAQALRILRRAPRPLIKTHTMPALGNWFRAQRLRPVPDYWNAWLGRQAAACYVVRDGRKVMCSYHQFVRGFDPSAAEDLAVFMRESEGGVSRVRAWADHVRAWMAQPGVLLLRFEDLVGQPEQTVARIGEHFALTARPVTSAAPRRLRNTLDGRLRRLLSVRPESSAILGSAGGVKPAAWHDAFSAADREFFDAETGDLLVELGYEESRDWARADAAGGH